MTITAFATIAAYASAIIRISGFIQKEAMIKLYLALARALNKRNDKVLHYCNP